MSAGIPAAARHATKVYGFEPHRVKVKAWSYGFARSREVYVDVQRRGEHIATVRLRVPSSTTRQRTSAQAGGGR